MSQNIDKVQVQIPGTMYYLQLTADRGRWILALLLRGDVENEVIVPVFSKNGIVKAANELLNNTRIQMEKYPLMNVCEQLFTEAERSLPVAQTPVVEEAIDDPEIDEMKQKIDLLETTLNNVDEELKESMKDINDRLDALENERVARIEKELAKDEYRGNEELYNDLTARLDKIEETIAETKGDDRVPSLITAIEALETKLSQLEGKTVTGSAAAEISSAEGSADIAGLKDNIGRLTQAFDLINQRLSNLEDKIAKTETTTPPESKPVVSAPIEGAPDISPPTTNDSQKFTEG